MIDIFERIVNKNINLIKYNFKTKIHNINILYYIILYIINKFCMGIGDWGLGIGDWGLGPIPNPQSPIPNPQSPF